MARETAGAVTAGVLHADARFTRLPAPDYDLDARGIRPGTAPTLSLAGGLLLLASPFGAWLRVTRLPAAEAPVEVVQEVLGRELAGGSFLVLVAVLATASTALWARPGRWARRAAHVAVWVTVVTVAVLVAQLQARITDAAAAAIELAGFHDLVAGAGWGAWAGVLGAAALSLSSAYAALADRPAATEGP